ncbi:MAG: antibiotic biosynthesis monooxygenase [Acidobacteria bacterium]|nr:antibiotic biosynthesis monooxygenase [Acidobacteriota bacterium]
MLFVCWRATGWRQVLWVLKEIFVENSKATFVVIAEFKVPARSREEFLELSRFDSERSLAEEAGCRQFDVSTGEEAQDIVVFYEVYDDRAAFDVHTTMPHFATFSEGLQRLGVETVGVRFFHRLYA